MTDLSHPAEREIRLWNSLGLRAAYGQMLLKMVAHNPRIYAVSADLGRSSGLDRFVDEYPENFVPVGIAEQNMVGFAAGLADSGLKVFCSSFAPFISIRAAEQVRMNLGYMGSPVNLIGMASGVSLGYLGASHYGLEDLSVIRAITGMRIFQPADAADLWAVLKATEQFEEPSYIRLTGGPSLNALDFSESQTGLDGDSRRLRSDGYWLKPPSTVAVVSSGTVSQRVQQAIRDLTRTQRELVGHFHAIAVRPLPIDLYEGLKSVDTILVVEEHQEDEGLVAELRVELYDRGETPNRLVSHGFPRGFMHGDDYERQLSRFRLDSDGIKGLLEELLSGL